MDTTSSTFMGLDVHKDTIAVSIRRSGIAKPENLTIPNQAEHVTRLARRLRARVGEGRVMACYEAGPTGFEVWRILTREGIPCDVVAPSLIPVKPGERRKTDRLDANALSEHLSHGSLTAIQVPTPAEEAARDLVRRSMKSRRQLANARKELLSLLLKQSVVWPGQNWTAAHRLWLQRLPLEQPGHRLLMEDSLRELARLEERVKWFDKHVEELSTSPEFTRKVAALRTMKGIDTFGAMVLVTELVAPERFPNARKLMAYVGLVVSENSSGLREHRMGLTKTGNSRARFILVEAAHHSRHGITKVGKILKARRRDQPDWALDIAATAERRLHDKHWALTTRGKNANTVKAAVARELAGFVWAMLMAEARTRPAVALDENGVVVG